MPKKIAIDTDARIITEIGRHSAGDKALKGLKSQNLRDHMSEA